jgi:hypothetical protein
MLVCSAKEQNIFGNIAPLGRLEVGIEAWPVVSMTNIPGNGIKSVRLREWLESSLLARALFTRATALVDYPF